MENIKIETRGRKKLYKSITCNCGNSAVVKGKCRKCYQLEYTKNKKTTQNKKIPKNFNNTEIYNTVLELVKSGYPIYISCEKVNIDRGTFYKIITEEQKNELISYKYLQKNGNKIPTIRKK
jgi:hypothetical protein